MLGLSVLGLEKVPMARVRTTSADTAGEEAWHPTPQGWAGSPGGSGRQGQGWRRQLSRVTTGSRAVRWENRPTDGGPLVRKKAQRSSPRVTSAVYCAPFRRCPLLPSSSESSLGGLAHPLHPAAAGQPLDTRLTLDGTGSEESPTSSSGKTSAKPGLWRCADPADRMALPQLPDCPLN